MQLTQIVGKRKPDWSKRVARAADLTERLPWAAEVLHFYRYVLEFQGDVYRKLPVQSQTPSQGVPLREAIDFEHASRSFPAAVAMLHRHGPVAMGESARTLNDWGGAKVEEQLRRCASGDSLPAVEQLLALVLMQPYAENLASHRNATNADSGRGSCPFCDGAPLASVLRPEGDGGKRWLLCSFCLSEWEFRRILCPYCGEQDNSKLPLFSDAEGTTVSIHACLTCRRYLKNVDMTTDGHAVPLVDEIATAPLDMWAGEQGYQKLQLNLLGF